MDDPLWKSIEGSTEYYWTEAMYIAGSGCIVRVTDALPGNQYATGTVWVPNVKLVPAETEGRWRLVCI